MTASYLDDNDEYFTESSQAKFAFARNVLDSDCCFIASGVAAVHSNLDDCAGYQIGQV